MEIEGEGGEGWGEESLQGVRGPAFTARVVFHIAFSILG